MSYNTFFNSSFIPVKNFIHKGFGITYHEGEAIHTVNFDVISNSYKGSQDALSVVRAFRILRDQSFFKIIEQNLHSLGRVWQTF